MRPRSLTVILGALLLATTCARTNPVSPAPLDQRFTLAPGQSVSLRGTSLRLAFLRVSGDSRCPADAVCIQGGDAVVHVRAASDSAAEYELHTGDEARAVVLHAGFHIRLEELQPYPFSSRTIAPDEYRATFTVAR